VGVRAVEVEIEDCTEQRPASMDRIFYNCKVRTMDERLPAAGAVAVEGGIIRYVGGEEAALALRTPDTELVDLHGAVLYPGFIDSHMHLLYSAFLRTMTDLSGCRSFAEAMAMLERETAALKASGAPDAWLHAVNFNQDLWEDRKELPTRADLDKAAGDVPCYITRVCGHVAVYNSRALELLGMTDRQDGIVYAADDQPGDRFQVRPGCDLYRAWAVSETARCAEAGLCSVHSDDMNIIAPDADAELVMQVFSELGESGGLSTRVFEQCRLTSAASIRAFAAAHPCGSGCGLFRTSSVKLLLDGSLGARSADLIDGFADGSKGPGKPVHTDEELEELALAAEGCGYPVVAHCIGDGAVERLLNTFDKVREKLGRRDPRCGVVHCQIMRTEQLERMAKDGVLAFVQPVFIKADAAVVDKCVTPELAAQSYNWRKMFDLGIHVSCGTDAPVESCDPIANIWHAVTRIGGDGKAWFPENAMTIDEALRAYTIEGAYAAGMQDCLGSVTEGKLADFTVLDRDLYETDPQLIINTKVLMTVVGGRTVYKNKEAFK
jgi:predicted amidohydrolase YtcJ